MKEKEQQIFEAVCSLLMSGTSVHEMTVSSIARAAGIGKGTVYEYFSSKDEILARSVLYGVCVSLDSITEALSRTKGFFAAMAVIFRRIEDGASWGEWTIDVITGSEKSLLAKLCAESALNEVKTRVHALLRCLVERAKEEGLVSRDASDEVCEFAAGGAISAFFSYTHGPFFHRIPERAARSMCLSMARAALAAASEE